jgi:DHA2 family multidrug resistance protein
VAAQPVNRGLIAASVIAATFMQVLDTTIANVALPHMQGSLSATQDEVSWVLTSYIVTSALAIPAIAWLASRFGRKGVFIIVVAGFTLASMLCGMAETLPQMIMFRILQGLFGAGLAPLSQAALLDTYPREMQAKAMATWALGITIAPIIGPTLGGWLTDSLSWRWVFYINLPIGICCLLGLIAFMPESHKDTSRRFDWTGFTFLSMAVGGLQMMLDRGQVRDWFSSTEIMIEAAIAGFGLYLFIVHAATSDRPIISLALFRDRNLVLGLIAMFLLSASGYTVLVLIPAFLQDIQGYPVLQAGIIMSPRAISSGIALVVVGRLINRVDPRLMMVAGVLMFAIATWQMTRWSADVPPWSFITTGLLHGAGMATIMGTVNSVAFSTIDVSLRGESTAMTNLVRNLGGSIGISITQTILAREIQINHGALAETVGRYGANARAMPKAWDLYNAHGLAALNAEMTRQAATIAYLNDYLLATIVLLTLIPVVLMFKLRRRRAASA